MLEAWAEIVNRGTMASGSDDVPIQTKSDDTTRDEAVVQRRNDSSFSI